MDFHLTTRTQQVSLVKGRLSVEHLSKKSEQMPMYPTPIKDITFITVVDKHRLFMQVHHRTDEQGKPLKSSKLRKYYFDASPEELSRFLIAFGRYSNLSASLGQSLYN